MRCWCLQQVACGERGVAEKTSPPVAQHAESLGAARPHLQARELPVLFGSCKLMYCCCGCCSHSVHHWLQYTKNNIDEKELSVYYFKPDPTNEQVKLARGSRAGSA